MKLILALASTLALNAYAKPHPRSHAPHAPRSHALHLHRSNGYHKVLRYFGHRTSLRLGYLQVVDERGRGIPHAHVLIGTALDQPFSGNFLRSDNQGRIPRHEAWLTEQMVTIEAPGYMRTTYNQVSPKNLMTLTLPRSTPRHASLSESLLSPVVPPKLLHNLVVMHPPQNCPDTLSPVGTYLKITRLPQSSDSDSGERLWQFFSADWQVKQVIPQWPNDALSSEPVRSQVYYLATRRPIVAPSVGPQMFCQATDGIGSISP